MIEVKGNIFLMEDASAICVTTNGVIQRNGELVMGKGIALAFKNRYSILPKLLGDRVGAYGNVPFLIPLTLEDKTTKFIISLPTKKHWRDKSDINLIISSIKRLVEITDYYKFEKVYLTQPGCGNGGLEWKEVKKVIEPLLDNRFSVISP